MLVKDLEQKVKDEILEERQKKIMEHIKTKKTELDAAKAVVEKLQENYDELLRMDVDSMVYPDEDFKTPMQLRSQWFSSN